MALSAKKILRSLLLFSLILSHSPRLVCAQSSEWTSIGPYTGSIFTIAIDPSQPKTSYVGTGGAGVFKTTDGGSSWTSANRGLFVINTASVRSLAIDHKNTNVIFAGTNIGIHKSTNGGSSWSLIRRDFAAWALAIDPSNSSIIYAGIWGGDHDDYLLKSTDGGASWTEIKNGSFRDGILSLAIDGSNTNIVYSGTTTGIFKSSDGGTTWAAAKTGLPDSRIFKIAIDPSDTSILYAATDSGLFKSRNRGENWVGINAGLQGAGTAFALAIDESKPSTIFAGILGAGIFKSTDGGTSWSSLNTGLANLDVAAIGLDPSNKSLLYAGTGRGFFLSENGGESWIEGSAGMHNTYIYQLALAPSNSNIIYAGTLSTQGVFKSTDAGASWAAYEFEASLYLRVLAIDPSNASTLIWERALG